MHPAQRHPLPGQRWHFQHGPIDIVIGADGDPAAVAAAHEAAWQHFKPLLTELVAELPRLRSPVDARGPNPCTGEVARRMWSACAALQAAAEGFITPMAAVAGSVAQALIGAYQRPGVRRAWVNNGGDIALHLAPGEHCRVGVVADLSRLDAQALARTATGSLRTDAGFTAHAAMPVRGVATSGWPGRSLSRGIADSVTVLAADAAQADAAATVIANAVDVDDPRIVRRPAHTVRDDSDLGERLVTVAVPPLPAASIERALQRGLATARLLQQQGRIVGALLACQGSLAPLAAMNALESHAPELV